MDPATVTILNVIIQIAISILVILTPVGIIAGIIVLVTGKGKETKKKRLHTIWGIIAIIAPIVLLFVILSIWGLVRIYTGTFHA
jgi:hypothetical protein